MRTLSAVLLGLLLALPAAAQQSGPAWATRERLREELARLERDGRSRAEVALIRARLESGDFQAGDRILVRVEGEQPLSDTFTVGPGPELVLPQIGGVPLAGVLRSELKDRLQTHLVRYLRDPVVQVRPLIRILVEGDVGRPGFYAVAPDLPLADVITLAGGLTPRAKATGIRVERGRSTIWGGESLQQGLGRGYSLDQLSLRAGDRVFVPARGDFARTAGIIGALMAVPVAIYTLTRIK
ncbi:MAG TPA: polysaccharide biosynthesis/export family protein [Gemmatimonadales bacterium]|jgi:protein involved in polysaccharide export with SLBB domain|nr:polysaccharide biosynthesis/export family protein [Gemmatimonadales bacterium]